jgi:heterodisulfide reductase subunit B
VLCTRNLAIAEQDHLDLVSPCSGCYKNHYFANASVKSNVDLADHMNFALEEDNLHYGGSIEVFHLMQVFTREVGFEAIRDQVSNPLKGLRVAPYYGCHLVRPHKPDQDNGTLGGPRYFEDLLSALGAEPVHFPLRMRCCGASLIATSRKAALSMLRDLIQSAVDAKADVIATACPLCQINIECYQDGINDEFGTELSIPTMYFTQLMGLAFGIRPKRLGIGRELVPLTPVVACARGEQRTGQP